MFFSLPPISGFRFDDILQDFLRQKRYNSYEKGEKDYEANRLRQRAWNRGLHAGGYRSDLSQPLP